MKAIWLGTLVFFSAASVGQAVSIDFEDGTSDSPVGGFYSGLGVTFSNTRWTNIGPLPGMSGSYGIYEIATSPGGTFQPDINTPLVATFSSPVSTVSINAIDVGRHGARVDAYDAVVGGNLVDFDQAFGPDVGVGVFFTLTAATANIRRIHMYQPMQSLDIGDGIIWDNLAFELVPEPSTLVLASVSVLGICGCRRRRQAAVNR